MHMKGASEIVLGLCTKYINESGQVVPLPDYHAKKLLATIEDYASQSLRTLCLAYKYVVCFLCVVCVHVESVGEAALD